MRQPKPRFSFFLAPLFWAAALCLVVSVQGCKKPADGGGGSTTSVPIEGVTVIREIIGLVVTTRDAQDFSGVYKNTPYSSLLIKISVPLALTPSSAVPNTSTNQPKSQIRGAAPDMEVKYYLVKNDLLIRDKTSVPNPLDEVTVEIDQLIATTSATDPSQFTIKYVTHVVNPEPVAERIIVQATTYTDLPENSPLGGVNYAICQIVPNADGISAIFAIKSLDVTNPAARSVGITFMQGATVYRNYLSSPAAYVTHPNELWVQASVPGAAFNVLFFDDGSHRCAATYNVSGVVQNVPLSGTWVGELPEI